MRDSIFNLEIDILLIIILSISFFTSYLLIPKLIGIIKFKNLMDSPVNRSSHEVKTPTLGGIVFYISLIFTIFMIQYFSPLNSGFNFLVGITILFFVGLKDDLMVLSPWTKLIAQLIAVILALMSPELWILNLDGFLSIETIPWGLGVIISSFIMIFIINSYNLIDGIDGLAGLLGVTILSIYSVFFYLSGDHLYMLLSIASIGSLVAFLKYNLSQRNKIFMGDTGSLIMGYIIAIMTVRLLSLEGVALENLHIKPMNKVLVIGSIIFFPTVDVARVILMRLINRKSPFAADRSHMHHLMIDKGLTHSKASFTLIICGLIMFGAIYSINSFISYTTLSMVFILLTISCYFILLILDSNKYAIIYRKKFKRIFPKKIQKFEFRSRKILINSLKKIFYKDLL